jgi:hypothetical protein
MSLGEHNAGHARSGANYGSDAGPLGTPHYSADHSASDRTAADIRNVAFI